jgi:hypothetical protein
LPNFQNIYFSRKESDLITFNLTDFDFHVGANKEISYKILINDSLLVEFVDYKKASVQRTDLRIKKSELLFLITFLIM